MLCSGHFEGFRGLEGTRDNSADPEKVSVWSHIRPKAHKSVVTLMKKPLFSCF